MRLYIGGRNQGKTEYVKAQQPDDMYFIWEGNEMPISADIRDYEKALAELGAAGNRLILNHLHLWVRRCVESGIDAQAIFGEITSLFPSAEVICDEIGNGIVPTEPLEREWREAVGRLLVLIAKDSERVERIVCGLPQVIKAQ